ncbi:MAG TPA: hypothetical protein DIT04_12860 [Dysgonomonas sp.]|nr:hypothetical protein [Dysgonomonas sp.]
MKTRILNAAAIAVLGMVALSSCNTNSAYRQTDSPRGEQVTEMTTMTDPANYEGMYTGVMPCADCEGIYVELRLSGGSYTMKEIYKGKGDDNANTFTEEGKYTWNDNNTVLTLNGDNSERYEVGNGVLYALDMDGKRVTGDLANMYILHKQ